MIVHECSLSSEMCEAWHGWERLMDYVVAMRLPAIIARDIDYPSIMGDT